MPPGLGQIPSLTLLLEDAHALIVRDEAQTGQILLLGQIPSLTLLLLEGAQALIVRLRDEA